MQNESRFVLVTGGAGYIGSVVAKKLFEQGWHPLVLDDLSRGHRQNLPPEIPLFVGDISGDDPSSSLDNILANFPIESVIHLAGRTKVDESLEHPELYFEENFLKACALLRKLEAHPIKNFIFSSTAAVYGEVQANQVTVHTPTHPINPYGWSKLGFEKALEAFSASRGVRTLILRYFNVVGAPKDLSSGPRDPRPSDLFRSLAQALVDPKKVFHLNGSGFSTPDGSPVRDFLHVEDLAQAHLQGLQLLQKDSDSDSRTLEQNPKLQASSKSKNLKYNLGNGRGYSVLEVVREFQKHGSLRVQQGPAREGDPSRVVCDPSEAFADLKWTPQVVELEDMVRSALSWEKKLCSEL